MSLDTVWLTVLLLLSFQKRSLQSNVMLSTNAHVVLRRRCSQQ